MKKRIFAIIIIVVIVLLAILMWWRYYFVFGEGVKAGTLNIFVRKGYVFKTWEGRLIQDGFKTETAGALQSNEFEFSVINDSVARVLELQGGKFVELRYKEYLHPIPWRGMSTYVVTNIVSLRDKPARPGELPLPAVP